MVFSSVFFIFYFLPAALLVYYAVPQKIKNIALTLISYVFYGWANPLFVLLMLASTLIDYVAGLVQGYNGFCFKGEPPELKEGEPRSKIQRGAMIASVVSNLAILGFFKYHNFACHNVDALLEALGLPGLGHTMNVVLPLGISFYTFQSMSYAIDVYRGHAKPMRSFGDFACFVAMFPQLVAGPIIRFSEIARQLTQRTHASDKFARGVAFFAFGLAKKALLANPCGKLADVCFDSLPVHALHAWLGAFAYSFQIYFDFSGYSDMAVGLGLMFGFVFARNFDMPYRSLSITEFWRRWHISLSSWLRDYLYIPLGGNRKGKGRTYLNLFLVMLLGGLWHGAGWTFVIWGGFHGIMLALERMNGKKPFYHRAPAWLQTLLTFLLVTFAWIFFRCGTLPEALLYIKCMFSASAAGTFHGLIEGILFKPYHLISFACAGICIWGCRDTWEFTQELAPIKLFAVFLLFAVSVLLLFVQSYNPFIYFIF